MNLNNKQTEKKLSPLDIVNFLFTNRDLLDRADIKSEIKESFMVNRRLAIGYPQLAQYLQKVGITDHQQFVEVWKGLIESMGVNYKPNWLYMKGIKK